MSIDNDFMDITSEAMKSLTACCVGAALTRVRIGRARAKQVRRLNKLLLVNFKNLTRGGAGESEGEEHQKI